MGDVSLRLGSILLALASVYALTSGRPRIGNVIQHTSGRRARAYASVVALQITTHLATS